MGITGGTVRFYSNRNKIVALLQPPRYGIRRLVKRDTLRYGTDRDLKDFTCRQSAAEISSTQSLKIKEPKHWAKYDGAWLVDGMKRSSISLLRNKEIDLLTSVLLETDKARDKINMCEYVGVFDENELRDN